MAIKSFSKPNFSLINSLKDIFEHSLKRNILKLGEHNKLRDACDFALNSGGKRIRPLIVMMTAGALGNKLDVMDACLSVEYFHTASLIADDLPCMDNDDYRRNKLTTHKVFGETISLLASYALIAAGYEKIFTNVQTLSKEKSHFASRANKTCVVALNIATRCSGVSGATGGQFKDIFSEEYTLKESLDVIYKKTVTLFEISFVFGWIFGGGDLASVEKVRDLAYHFGVAFQIADDLTDMNQDIEKSLNIGHILGKEKSRSFFKKELDLFFMKLKKLGIVTPEFQQMVDLLIYYVNTTS